MSKLSILDEVLIEEYGRCERHKRLYQAQIKELSRKDKRRKEYKERLCRAKRDQRTIQRGLGIRGISILREVRKNAP